TEQVGITMDLTRSLVRIAGAKAPERGFDGIDILERLEKNEPALERTLFWRARRGERTWWGVRDGSLKYVARADAGKKVEFLYDLARDPGEKTNLLSSRSNDVERVRRLLAAWEKDVQPKR